MQAIGILVGLLMGVSFFLKWEAVIEGLGAVKINHFLGIQNNAFFSLFGRRVDFVPIVLALALILAMALAKSKPWRMIALVVALLCLAIAARDIRHIMPLDNLKPGLGLWLFAAASLLAVIAAVALVVRKKVSSPAR